MDAKNNNMIFSDFLSLPNNPEDLFTLLYPISKGDNNEIYKAIYKETRELVAIKIISYNNIISSYENMNENHNVDSLFEKLKQESMILKNNFNCEYILKYYGSFLSFRTNSIWLIFEYCHGGSINDLMTSLKRSLTEKEISMIINMILHGLVALHQLNIIHRNIKGNNILLTENGKAKISNFNNGIQLLNYELSLSKDNSFYDYDTKYDIFLLGITCIELFKGINNNICYRKDLIDKFININNNDALYTIIENEINLKGESKNFSEEFIDFLSKCLDKKSFKKPTAFELINHCFIKKYINHNNLNEFFNFIKENADKIENTKKQNFEISPNNYIFINMINRMPNHQNKIINKNDDNSVRSNIDCINFFEDKNANNISNINNNEENGHYVDKLAEFRIEQLKNEEEVEYDKFTNKDILIDSSNLDNIDLNYLSQNSNTVDEKILKKSATFAKIELRNTCKENDNLNKGKSSLIQKILLSKKEDENEEKIKLNQTTINQKMHERIKSNKNLANFNKSILRKESDDSEYKKNWEHLNKYQISDDASNINENTFQKRLLSFNNESDSNLVLDDKIVNNYNNSNIEEEQEDIPGTPNLNSYIETKNNKGNIYSDFTLRNSDDDNTNGNNNFLMYNYKDTLVPKKEPSRTSLSINIFQTFTLKNININNCQKINDQSIISYNNNYNSPISLKNTKTKDNSSNNNMTFTKNTPIDEPIFESIRNNKNSIKAQNTAIQKKQIYKLLTGRKNTIEIDEIINSKKENNIHKLSICSGIINGAENINENDEIDKPISKTIKIKRFLGYYNTTENKIDKKINKDDNKDIKKVKTFSTGILK